MTETNEKFKERILELVTKHDGDPPLSFWCKGTLLHLLAMEPHQALKELGELMCFLQFLENEGLTKRHASEAKTDTSKPNGSKVICIDCVSQDEIDKFNEGRARVGAPELDMDYLIKMQFCSELSKKIGMDPIQIIQNLNVDESGNFYWHDRYVLQQLNIKMNRPISMCLSQDIFEDHYAMFCKTYITNYHEADSELSHIVHVPHEEIDPYRTTHAVTTLKEKGYLNFLQEQHHITGGVEVRKVF